MANVRRPDRARGIIETLLIVDGSPVELEPHLGRLGRSAKDLFAAELPGDIEERVLEGASTLPLGRLRLTVAPVPGGALAAESATARVDPDDLFPSWERAIDLRPTLLLGGLGAHKWADRKEIAQMEAAVAQGSLPLLMDEGGEVLEATRSNVFAVEGEALITPPADGRILPGVARARVIAVARSLGMQVRERALRVERLIGAGEVFLTNSIRGVEPVRAVGATGLERPGEAVRAIVAEMTRSWMGKGAPSWVRSP